ncbi:MAG: transporter substrate-binding domain-containing protein [Ruminococcaceae bacterium]|nr:transporter substrate-binding domain-containing protein [Oscillospiraceae bacterium]
MKKIISIVLAAALMLCTLFALASCGGANYKVGVQSGTTGWSFMSGDADWGFTGFPTIDVASYDNGSLAVSALKAGNVDFVVIDADVAKALVAENAGTKVIDIALTTESYGIAVDKKQTELLASINGVLASKKAEIDAIFTKYANVDDSNAANWTGDVIPAGTYDSSKNQLVVATNAAFAPFEFTVGNGFAGIDMEIAKLVADELGMELVIKDMDFDAITTSLGVNGIDVGIAAMTINPARQEVVNFSDSYYTDAYQVIIVKEGDTTFDACKTTEDVLKTFDTLSK